MRFEVEIGIFELLPRGRDLVRFADVGIQKVLEYGNAARGIAVSGIAIQAYCMMGPFLFAAGENLGAVGELCLRIRDDRLPKRRWFVTNL